MKGVAEHSFVWVEKYFFTFFVPHSMGNKVFINIPLIPLKFDWLSENPHTLLYSLVYTMSSLNLALGRARSHPYNRRRGDFLHLQPLQGVIHQKCRPNKRLQNANYYLPNIATGLLNVIHGSSQKSQYIHHASPRRAPVLYNYFVCLVF